MFIASEIDFIEGLMCNLDILRLYGVRCLLNGIALTIAHSIINFAISLKYMKSPIKIFVVGIYSVLDY